MYYINDYPNCQTHPVGHKRYPNFKMDMMKWQGSYCRNISYRNDDNVINNLNTNTLLYIF